MITLYSIFQDFIKQTKIYIQNVLPKKVSELTNDVGYITSHQDISGKQDKLTFDTTPTANSFNPVTSGGIKTALDNKLDKTGNAVSATKAVNDGNGANIASTYVKKAGDTTTGKITFASTNLYALPEVKKTSDDNMSGIRFSSKTKFLGAVGKRLSNGEDLLNLRSDNSSTDVVLDSRNYNNYAPTKTGAGASGTWNINISGTATKAKQDASGNVITDTYAKKTGTGASGTWDISITGNASTATKLQTPRTLSLSGNASGSTTFDGSGNAIINTTVNTINNQGNKTAIKDGTAEPLGLNLYEVYQNGYPTSYGNLISIGGAGGGELLAGWSPTDHGVEHLYYRNRRDHGGLWSDWSTIAFTTDINNYAPTKTGDGASGTWGINISGNAANDGNGANIANTYLKLNSFKSSLIASLPACYERSTMWSAAKNVITVPDYITVNIGNNGYVKTGASTIDVNTASNWDNSTYATSANRAGKDFYIYACQASGTVPKFVLSANSTVPTGYTATNSRKIGGFHCECADVGTISGHPLSGYIAGDILPRSIWDLKHRPVSSPEGMVWCDGVWVDIYLAGWDGSKLVSQYKAVIQDGDSTKKWHGELFNEEFHKIKKRLLWRDEFATYAKGSNEKTNIAGNSDPNTTGGHKDTANRRMISNYGLEDCCGVLWQWTNDISMRGIVTNGTDSDYASSGNYWLNGYGWDSANRIGNSDIDGDKTKYGNEYGLLVRLFAGGNWNCESYCGSRSVGGSSLSARRSGYHAGRGASEPWVG